MDNAIDALTAAFFKFWKDSYIYLKSENNEPYSKDYKRYSITNYLSDGMAYSVAQGLMQYTKIQTRPSQGDQWQPLFPGGDVKIASTTFLPSPYPKSQFQYAKILAPLFNQLANNASNNPSWLIEQLKPMAKVDDYVKRLLDICQRIYVDGEKDFSKELKLHLFRSDYMTHLTMNGDKPSLNIKQIELNVVSVSLASYVNSLAPIHKVQVQNILQSTPFFNSFEALNETHPSNNPLHEFGYAFHAAQKVYQERYNSKHPLAVMWLVDPNDLNEVDHRHLAFTLQNEYGLNVIRATFNELYSMRNNGTLFIGNEYSNHQPNTENYFSKSNTLFITESQGDWEGSTKFTYEVAIIYLRSGYSPDHFTCEEDWEIYEWLENTKATKVPAVPTLLAGMKKIQQAFCDHQTLNKFTNFAHELEPCFALQIDCNDTSPLAMETMHKAIENPENYVLKPQREGGGNNLHDKELADTLKAHLEMLGKSTEETNRDFVASSEYILMEKIKPPELPTVHYKTPYPSKEVPHPLTKPLCMESVGELGIYGTAVYDGETEVINKYAGYLMRTKSSKDNEGGFVTGVSSMDSIFLYDDSKFLKSFLKSLK